MRPQKSAILIAAVVLLLTALVAVMAQTPSQAPAKSADKKAECCCKDDSCPMMKKDGTTSADMTAAGADMKHDCCGDSCDMKEGMTAGTDTAKAGADAKHDCCGDSCDMANHAKHNMAAGMKHDMKHAADGSCCKMKSKDAKQKDAQKDAKDNDN